MRSDLRPRLEAVVGGAITSRSFLIFDEVQCCKRALTSLKYFCEEAPDLPVAAAGSLLGVAIRPADSGWPVGKVRTMTLAPMDFLEFLDAVGEHRLLPIIEEAYRGNKPVERIFHERLLRKVREFLVVGGMPESVATARDAGTFDAMAWEAVREVQAELLRNSIADMARYAPPREPLSRKPRDSNFGKEFRHPWPSTFRAAIRSKFCGVKGFVLRAFGFPL